MLNKQTICNDLQAESAFCFRRPGFRSCAVLQVLVLLLLSACTTVPETIRDAPETSPSLSEVRQSPLDKVGQRVRWGGSIVEVRHRDNNSEIQIVARPLSVSARPIGEDQSEGRFIARLQGFLEPEIYSGQRLITVVGTVAGVESRSIDEMSYDFPVIQVQSYHLWPKIQEVPVYPYYYYDPFRPLWPPHPYHRFYGPPDSSWYLHYHGNFRF